MVKTHIFFDFGGTLAHELDEAGGASIVWTRAGSEVGLDLPITMVRDALSAVDLELTGQIYDYLGRTDEFWTLYQERVMDRLGVVQGQEDLQARVQRAFDDPSRIERYPETLDVLETLEGGGFRLGVISNHHDGLLKVLKHLDLDRFFDTVTYSQEAGAEKPDTAVFTLALSRAQCRPSRAVFVGNSWEADVQGAARAGLHPVWINRTQAERPGPCDELEDLRGLPKLLHRLT